MKKENKKEKLAEKIWNDTINDPYFHEEYEDRFFLYPDKDEYGKFVQIVGGVSFIAEVILNDGFLYRRLDVMPDHKTESNNIYIHVTKEKTLEALLDAGFSFKEINKILREKG